MTVNCRLQPSFTSVDGNRGSSPPHSFLVTRNSTQSSTIRRISFPTGKNLVVNVLENLVRTSHASWITQPRVRSIAARRQRRPLSSYIEWAIEESLAHVQPGYDPSAEFDPPTFKDVANDLWDVDEPDRFIRLAIRYPFLLDHEEQRLWKLICESGCVWKGNHKGENGEWQWTVKEGSMIWDRLRQHWDTFYRVANGELENSDLPSWQKFKVPSGKDLDDEIPF